jgi:phage shock protein PspC (stress-responsive transcriptional regulator)
MTDTTALPPPSDLPPPGSSTTATPLFVRPREGRMFAGVCAGIAGRWNLDVTLVRIVTVVLALLSGVGLAAYIAAWLLTPSVDGPAPLEPGSPLAASITQRGGGMRRAGRVLLIVLLALLLVGLVHSWWWGVPFGLVVVASVLVLAFGTRVGRWVVAGLALLVALAIAAVAAFGPSFGSRSLHVTSADDLRSSYDYGTGALRLDLTGITSVAGEHRTSVHLGRGAVTVTLPPGVPVLVHARAGVGSVRIDGHQVGGIDAEQTVPIGAGSATATDRLVLDISVGAGTVTVRTT